MPTAASPPTGPVIPITRKLLLDWAGPQVLQDAEVVVAKGLVLEASYEPPLIKGSVLWNNRALQTELRVLSNGSVENRCPCYANKERGVICSHVIALALTLVKRATDPLREEKYQQEIRRASRLAHIDESQYIQRVKADETGAVPARLQLVLATDWVAAVHSGRVPMHCELQMEREILSLDQAPRDIPFAFSKQDEALLYVLEDICEGPARGDVELQVPDFINLIEIAAGRSFVWRGHDPVIVNNVKVQTYLKMDLNRANGELSLYAHTELPFTRPDEEPLYVVAGRSGWVYGAGNLWPLENLLPAPYHPIYSEPTRVQRPDVLRFLQKELPAVHKFIRVESDITTDLFVIEPAEPAFHLRIKGSPASMMATLIARYGTRELVAGRPDPAEHFGLPDPDDLMRYLVRNPASEDYALRVLAQAGFTGPRGDNLEAINGSRGVLNFLGGCLPALRRRGWTVTLEGRVSGFMDELGFAMPVVHVSDVSGGGWFDVGFDFEETQGMSLSHAEIQTALRKGESFLQKQGRTVLIDGNAVESMMSVFQDCATGESHVAGHFRMANIYAAFVKSSLDALDGIDVEDTPAWRTHARQLTGTVKIDAVELPEPLNSTLRPYQKEGVSWLTFMENNGFCGLLADEMGLGKTLQTLVWLQFPRRNEAARGKPILIVCPTSLVENWAEETARFVPAMTLLTMTGSDRHEKWKDLARYDIGVVSYAILRRDIEMWQPMEFSVVVLDEAQHIKNRSTQNALAAKKLQAYQRLVLTGTPMENSVADLWSIMDFLMPGYLGGHESFKHNYETPISHEGPESDAAKLKLKRKLKPFMMRRLKTQVARDLPDKLLKVQFCTLTADQRGVYSELLKNSQNKITRLVSDQGFNRSRMEILAILMRLRQVCCHLGLLQLEGLNAQFPSAKMDALFELLDEALDGGHRVLIFSQFVTMLTILRTELEQRGVSYCYLDGSTKDRQEIVHKFNSDHTIPVFLISLKAGGSGLNLTGADMVVHFDPWWNPAVEDQATDRAHRIGQKRTVYSIKLITKDTVEEKVLALQQKKRNIINATIESDEKVMEAMNWQDIQDLLGM